MFHLALAAALVAAVPSPGPPADVRVIRSTNARTRFVRVAFDIEIAGIRGTESAIFDLATGRAAERVSAGALSYGDGFDGVRSWSSDATGMPLIAGNADVRLDMLAWAHFFGRTGPERPTSRTLRSRDGNGISLRLTYPALSGPIDVTLDATTGRVRRIVDRSGVDVTVARFDDYRRVGDVVLPFRLENGSRYGTTRERVRSIAFPRTVADGAFAPPQPPDDTTLDGMTTVPMRLVDDAPVVPIRIDGGPTLHVLFDSGASNALTPRTARRLGIAAVGHDLGGGMGAGLVSHRYATVKRLQIGAAVLANQPFSILGDDAGGLDGVIGCEVLQRLAARFDFAGRHVDLVRDVARFGIASPAIPMRLAGCTPEIDGALDGLPGPIAIDTGSSNFFDVMTPFVRRHRLLARYRAGRLTSGGAGVGGRTVGYEAFAARVRLGNVTLRAVPITLSAMTAGALNDPTELGNAGVPAFARFVTVFDYRNGRMWLLR